MRRIVANRPGRHLDVGSHNLFANLLSAVVPVTFLDYRPLNAKLAGLSCVGGNILELPFADDSAESLSCLHVAEHIGLGRYGDPLDPEGTKKAVRELGRVLAGDGRLYFALPVGRPRVCFNAHRVHSPEAIREMTVVNPARLLAGPLGAPNSALAHSSKPPHPNPLPIG